jgi:purine-binding chemotaxis protein CheW
VVANETSAQAIVLVVDAGSRLCAIPIADVVETMRPLEVESVPGMPRFLMGIAIIRGSPIPVVALGELLGTRQDKPIGRYVLLNLGEHKIALAVEKVLGVRRLDDSVMHGLPPLLKEPQKELVAEIGVKDERLLLVLRATRMIPDEVWQTLEESARGEA